MNRMVLVGALAVFFLLAYAVNTDRTGEFDRAVREGVQAAEFPLLTAAMFGITLLGWDLVVIPLAAALWWRFAATGRKREGLFLFVAVAGADVLLNLVKLAFARPRPEAAFGYHASGTFSFPSGHAVLAVCLYGTVAVLAEGTLRSAGRKSVVLLTAALLILLIGASRVYLGIHHPSDVLAGYAFAVAWLAFLSAVLPWRKIPE